MKKSRQQRLQRRQRSAKLHWWPHAPEERPCTSITHARAICGARVLGRHLTWRTHRVSCPNCRKSLEYKATAVERRLQATTCSQCEGTGRVPVPDAGPDVMEWPSHCCITCDGSGVLVPCLACGGEGILHNSSSWDENGVSTGVTCDACNGRGYEPL